MSNYRTETRAGKTIIWDDEANIGLQFTDGDILQLYTSEIVIKQDGAAVPDIATIERVQNELTKYAAEHFPKEFAEIVTDY